MKKQKHIKIRGELLAFTPGLAEFEVSIDQLEAVNLAADEGRLIRIDCTGSGAVSGRIKTATPDGESIKVNLVDARQLPAVDRLSLQELDRADPGKSHLYNSIDGGGQVLRHAGYEAFIYACIDGSYQFRGGYRSHLNLSKQEGGFESAGRASEAAESWIRDKAAAAAARSVMRSARLG